MIRLNAIGKKIFSQRNIRKLKKMVFVKMMNYENECEIGDNYEIDVQDGLIRNKKNGKFIGNQKFRNDYNRVTINGNTFYVHRLVYSNAKKGSIKEGFDIDHINGDKTDNKIDNLREVTHEMNMKRVMDSIRNKSHEKRRRVKCINQDGIETIYPSQNACGRALGINTGVISMILQGKCKKTQGQDGYFYRMEDMGTNPNNFKDMDSRLRQCLLNTRFRISKTIDKENKNEFIQACIEKIQKLKKYSDDEKEAMKTHLEKSL